MLRMCVNASCVLVSKKKKKTKLITFTLAVRPSPEGGGLVPIRGRASEALCS